MDALALFLQMSVQWGTPFLLAALGGMMCEKVGNLNLGIEGMMMMGAMSGFAAGFQTENALIAVLAGAAGGVAAALIYGIITITLKGNQTVTGFAIAIFGTGFANFFGQKYTSQLMPDAVTDVLGTHEIPGLSQIPILGKMLFSQNLFVWLSIGLALLLFFYFQRTRQGLASRMVGENPAAADAAGIRVNLCKYVHVCIGGALCGLGGAYLSLVYVPYWQDDIVSGMGWIAVALVIFSVWDPLRAVFSCYLFGILKAAAIKFQGVSITIGSVELSLASQVLDMMPYILTIVVLILTAAASKKQSAGPAGIGRAYFREDR